MLRRMMMAVLAVAAIGLSAPQVAQARGFGHGGWGHGGGWGRGGHWHGGGFWPGVAIGAGLAGAGYYGAYYGYGSPYYGDPYYYGTGYNDGYGGCYVARKRVMTPAGWRTRRVDVCE
ncbi:hypothetical protein [Bradyrhizobium sp. 141]|uniref:hypothetical protein n=1 Tax=Bradyrhizobium sp. 141 TaxID=2782617 RepID=UPI001FFA8184|nr:hypothetical protein [Bradyrhizobium sp. 141]MCK1722987.1 hypothetical protein [Bradyrhizobium sp. 141]